jgi:hypothetical protein
MVSSALKHSLNVSVDFADPKQALYGYRTLNLLNSHEDPTYLRTILYLQAARDYIPAPKANLARVVINGESWGAFVSQQQFNDEFEQEWFQTTKGARWKGARPPGRARRPRVLGRRPVGVQTVVRDQDEGRGEILGRAHQPLPRPQRNPARPARVRARADPRCRRDAQVPRARQRVRERRRLLGARERLRDLSRSEGQFHILPHDANECSAPASVPGCGRGGGPRLDALGGPRRQLQAAAGRSCSPSPHSRTRYLGYVRAIATKWLDWKTLQPLVTRYQALIAPT